MVEDLRREEGEQIQMKLDKTKVLETEQVLHQLLSEMIELTNGKTRDLRTNELLRLVGFARKAAEGLLFLGLALPVGVDDC